MKRFFFSSFFFSDALRTNSNSPDVLALRGLVLFLSGKMEQAKTHAANALRLDPSCEPAMKLRKRVRDVERLKEEGNTAFKASRLLDAVQKYTEALEVSFSHIIPGGIFGLKQSYIAYW